MGYKDKKPGFCSGDFLHIIVVSPSGLSPSHPIEKPGF